MSLIFELLAQAVWEGIITVAYRRGGWFAGATALFAPFLLIGLLIWLATR